MTGRLVHTPLDDLKHVTFALDLDDGNTIYFKDTRKFGRIYWYSSVDAFENSHQLGIEPLSDDFSPTYLENILKNYRQQIKPFLLNQKYLVGLGNIYVDEALWLTEIHPTTPCHTLSPGKIYQLHSSIQEILRQSIQLNGTTFLNFYFDKDQKGSYKELLNVFGRQGQKCNRCHDTIKKIRIAQRGTHYCATCQPVQQ
jgi:formamidopyrimidine-DNA glycosylase